MNEWFEIEVIACCPKCGHNYCDWISFEVGCPFLVEDASEECNKKGGCTAL